MIRSFKKLAKEEEPLAGGKGRTLAMLYCAGYRVPDGFIILPAAFAGDELTDEAWAQVQAHLAHLRRGSKQTSFAVRSSALSEDSAQMSFAGEFETVLNVQADDEISSMPANMHARFGVNVAPQFQGMDDFPGLITDFAGIEDLSDLVLGVTVDNNLRAVQP